MFPFSTHRSMNHDTSHTPRLAPANRRQTQLQVEALEDRVTPSTIYGVLPDNTLIHFDSANPAAVTSTAVTGLESSTERIIGIDFRPRTGQLYATTVPVGIAANALLRTYRVNTLTGAATFIGSIPNTVPGAADVPSGYDFNPTVDRIRSVNTNDANYRMNPNNGSLAGLDVNLNPAGSQIIAEAYDRNFDRANATTIPTTLYGISRATSSLVTQGGINGTAPGGPNGGLIVPVGPLGVTLDAGDDAGFDITGDGRAFAALTVGGSTGLYTINLTTGAATLVGAIGSGATQLTGLTVVPEGIRVTGADAGGAPQVVVLDAFTSTVKFSFRPYSDGFTGGVRVAAGDVNGDGVADVITGAGPGGVPHVRVFDGRTGAQVPGFIGSFYAFDAGFSGGVYVAGGDVNGDGFEDVIVGADAGGAPHVRVFSGKDGSVLRSFYAYSAGFSGGVRVAAGDLNLDGFADIITGAGSGGAPHVEVFSGGSTSTMLLSFYAYSAGFAGGVFVAGGDVNGDGIADVVTGAGAGGAPHVEAFSGSTGAMIQSFYAYDAFFAGGVRVATADVNRDGRLDIMTAPGPGDARPVRVFDGVSLAALNDFLTYPGFNGGVFVGGKRR